MQYNRMTDKAVNDLAEFNPQEGLFLEWKTRVNLVHQILVAMKMIYLTRRGETTLMMV